MFTKTLCLLLLLIICTGCSQRILLLKRFASSQKEMENYVARQERGFLRLKKDIQRDLLQKGIPRKLVIKKYGEPVFCAATDSDTAGYTQSCLYRAPTEYFSVDKVYLYFDREECLHSWKYEPLD